MRYIKGQSDNPNGRPAGRTVGAKIRQAIENHSTELIESILKSALNGDMVAAKMLLDRIAAPLRPAKEPVIFDMADSDGVDDLATALLGSVSRGELRPEDCTTILALVQSQKKMAKQQVFDDLVGF